MRSQLCPEGVLHPGQGAVLQVLKMPFSEPGRWRGRCCCSSCPGIAAGAELAPGWAGAGAGGPCMGKLGAHSCRQLVFAAPAQQGMFPERSKGAGVIQLSHTLECTGIQAGCPAHGDSALPPGTASLPPPAAWASAPLGPTGLSPVYGCVCHCYF